MRCDGCGREAKETSAQDGEWFARWIVKRQYRCEDCDREWPTYEIPSGLLPQAIDKEPLYLEINRLIEILTSANKTLAFASRPGIVTHDKDGYAIVKKAEHATWQG